MTAQNTKISQLKSGMAAPVRGVKLGNRLPIHLRNFSSVSANHCLTGFDARLQPRRAGADLPALFQLPDDRARIDRFIISAARSRVPQIDFGDFGVEGALELPDFLALERLDIEIRIAWRDRRSAKSGRATGARWSYARSQPAPARAIGALYCAVGAPHDLRFVERLENLGRVARAAAAAFGQRPQFFARRHALRAILRDRNRDGLDRFARWRQRRRSGRRRRERRPRGLGRLRPGWQRARGAAGASGQKRALAMEFAWFFWRVWRARAILVAGLSVAFFVAIVRAKWRGLARAKRRRKIERIVRWRRDQIARRGRKRTRFFREL